MLKVDSHEPVAIETMLRQVLGDLVVRGPLNQHHFADYTYNWWDGTLDQTERKHVEEILTALEDVEYQLVSEIFHHPDAKMNLIIEGLAAPTPLGIQTYRPSKNYKVWTQYRTYKIPFQRYERWKIDLERQGVLIWQTADEYGTAQALVAMYKSAQVTDNNVLMRHLRVKGAVQPKPDDWEETNGKKPWKPDPYVQTLINTPDNGFGVEIAERAIDLFGTPWDLYRQDIDTLANHIPGVSKVKARQFLKAVGRNV